MNRVVVGVLLVVVALGLGTSGLVVMERQGMLSLDSFPFTGKAAGQALLCINTPPEVNFSLCPSEINQSTRLIDNGVSCNITVFEPDGESYVMSIAPDSSGVWASLLNNELYLWPFQDHVGDRSINVTVVDDSGCANGNVTVQYNFTVLNINDPPDLIEAVADVKFASGRSISPYSLYLFFDDPDDDVLEFSVFGANKVSVSIVQSTGNVIYSSDKCGKDYLFFRATDPFGLFVDSDIVEIEVTCQDVNQGGGGGGGSSNPIITDCHPLWDCGDWSECFMNGTRMRECYDQNGCSLRDYHRVFWENCTYIPTCYDGILNNNEEGIDCGGPCPPCGTCYDGIMNNDEEGIDCGGISCEPCFNCTNGVQDWDETGVDCGGPFCNPCMSCFDGVQNNGETGVDCGGPCPVCKIGEVPGVVEQDSRLTTLLLLLLVLLIVLLILFKFYHKQLYAAVAKLGWYATRKQRKQVLLNEAQKKDILGRLTVVDETLLSQSVPAAAVMEKLTEVSRLYFTYALGLPFVFLEVDLVTLARQKMTHDSLRRVFHSFFKKMERFEQVAERVSPLECQVVSEELRQLVFQTSVTSAADLVHDADELSLQGSGLEQCWQSLYNVFLALQFEEVGAAKNHYLLLLDRFNVLGEQQKGLVAGDVIRAYYEIRYLLSWSR